MTLPTDLSQWTYETVVGVVNGNDYEPGRFDFKEVLHATRKEDRAKHNANICKEVCAMANTIGGFLIFGVKDGKAVASPDEDRIIGIPIGGEHRKEFGEKLTAIQPIPRFESVPQAIRLSHVQDRSIFVVQIPQSPLDYYQVRELMLTTQERLGKIALLRIEIGVLQAFITHMSRLEIAGVIIRDRLDPTALQILLADTSVLSLDVTVLRPLLTLPATVNRINGHLDMYTRIGKAPTELPAEVLQAAEVALNEMLKDVHQFCTECDRRLEGVVGPQPYVNAAKTDFAASLWATGRPPNPT
jgi:hypothetical protein